jgi:hypothetical protein
VLIKRFGNIIKVYASSVASLFAAAISHWLLHDPPPALFYLGVALAMAATLQLQRARSQESNSSSAKQSSSHKAAPAAQWLRKLSTTRLAVGGVTMAATLVLMLLLKPPVSSTSGAQSSLPAPATHLPAGMPPALSNNSTTDAPMGLLPPFEPTCFVIHEERVKVRQAAVAMLQLNLCLKACGAWSGASGSGLGMCVSMRCSLGIVCPQAKPVGQL